MIATAAGEWFPYDWRNGHCDRRRVFPDYRNNSWFFFFNDGSDRCDHIETTLKGLEPPIILAKANILIRNVMNFYEMMWVQREVRTVGSRYIARLERTT